MTIPTDRLFDGLCPDDQHDLLEPSINPISERDAGWCEQCQAWWAPDPSWRVGIESVDLTVPGKPGEFTLWRVDATELNAARGGVPAILAHYRAQTLHGWGKPD
ncbi:hypothetical protein [Cryptosporangium phraense]|uniref:Uncharacterized protein n=1 Tax=Cryptosporangium phraense TaxID=2593070 RepID=A0A545AX01_9ACTN|nr:hypothetical protein [Cryptosporangium phraense]TQS45848.1 hypothetical protein FL583_04825 [Cryptosporangium phraense]